MGHCIIARRGGEDKSRGLTATADKILPGYTALVNGSVLTGTATADATATAADIASGKTSYVNGVKVTGTAKLFPTSVSLGGYSYDNEYETSYPVHPNAMPSEWITGMNDFAIVGTYLRIHCNVYTGTNFYLFLTLN